MMLFTTSLGPEMSLRLWLLFGAFNFIGAESSSKNVAILEDFDEQSRERAFKENAVGELSCRHRLPQTHHAAQLVWKKDGKPLRSIELGTEEEAATDVPRDDGRILISRDNGSLILNSVLASDAGHYVCELSVAGYATVSSGVRVVRVSEQLKFAPQPAAKNLEVGTQGKVYCKAQGNPTPEIKWTKAGKEFDSVPAAIVAVNGTLIFRNVSAEHSGNYTCTARSGQSEISATVAITAVIAPKFTVLPQVPHEVLELLPAILIDCQATGDPVPTIQWDKDLEYLNENNTDAERFRFHANGTLEIRDVRAEDEGRYGCTIGSSAGLKREDVLLLVRSPHSTSNFIVTRIIIYTMLLALIYFVVVVCLKLWYRYRRQDKVTLNGCDEEQQNVATEHGTEHEPCLTGRTAPNTNSSNSRTATNNGRKLRESIILEQESQLADDLV